jgi:hypothetical protein
LLDDTCARPPRFSGGGANHECDRSGRNQRGGLDAFAERIRSGWLFTTNRNVHNELLRDPDDKRNNDNRDYTGAFCENRSGDGRRRGYRGRNRIARGDRPFDRCRDGRRKRQRIRRRKRRQECRLFGIGGSPGGNRCCGTGLVIMPAVGGRRLAAVHCRHRSDLLTLIGWMLATGGDLADPREALASAGH